MRARDGGGGARTRGGWAARDDRRAQRRPLRARARTPRGKLAPSWCSRARPRRRDAARLVRERGRPPAGGHATGEGAVTAAAAVQRRGDGEWRRASARANRSGAAAARAHIRLRAAPRAAHVRPVPLQPQHCRSCEPARARRAERLAACRSEREPSFTPSGRGGAGAVAGSWSFHRARGAVRSPVPRVGPSLCCFALIVQFMHIIISPAALSASFLPPPTGRAPSRPGAPHGGSARRLSTPG